MSRGKVQQSDRRLNEAIRQQNIPAELEKQYPNIAATIGASNIGQSDMDAMAELSRNIINRSPSTAARPGSSLGFLRMAEDKAGTAFARDIAGTENPDEFIKYLQKQDNTNYKVTKDPSLGKLERPLLGYYQPYDDTMTIDPTLPINTQLATLLHEHGHAIDTVRSESPEKLTQRVLQSKEVESLDPILDTTTQSTADLDAVSKLTAGKHFKEPGSYVLNKLLKTSKDIGQQAGVEPNYKAKYKDILKLLGK